uniref:Phosphoseryl-tRNA kinase n=1 Tax=Calidris pygmaea TaxID=425635 RepID=A0A8C3JWV4_9CHAR
QRLPRRTAAEPSVSAGGGGGARGRRRARPGGAVPAVRAAGRRQVHPGPRPAPPPPATPRLGLRPPQLRRAHPAGGLRAQRAGGGTGWAVPIGQCGALSCSHWPAGARRVAASRPALLGNADEAGPGRHDGGAPGGRRGGRVRVFTPPCLPPQLPSWKRSRRELLQCLERFLRALVTGEPLSVPPAAEQPGWERFLACCRRQGLLATGERQGRAGTPAATAGPLYLILDDNFYYQSMRYEVYQLARKYSLSFCQLFLDCPLECCLQRNRLRSHPVPDQTICLMARKIEMPDLKKNAWEQNSLILKSFDCTSEDEYVTGLMVGFSISCVFRNRRVEKLFIVFKHYVKSTSYGGFQKPVSYRPQAAVAGSSQPSFFAELISKLTTLTCC